MHPLQHLVIYQAAHGVMHGHLAGAFVVLFDGNQNQRLQELMPVEVRLFSVLQLPDLQFLQARHSVSLVYDGRVHIRVLHHTVSLPDGVGETHSGLTLRECGVPGLERRRVGHFATLSFALLAIWVRVIRHCAALQRASPSLVIWSVGSILDGSCRFAKLDKDAVIDKWVGIS